MSTAIPCGVTVEELKHEWWWGQPAYPAGLCEPDQECDEIHADGGGEFRSIHERSLKKPGGTGNMNLYLRITELV